MQYNDSCIEIFEGAPNWYESPLVYIATWTNELSEVLVPVNIWSNSCRHLYVKPLCYVRSHIAMVVHLRDLQLILKSRKLLLCTRKV